MNNDPSQGKATVGNSCGSSPLRVEPRYAAFSDSSLIESWPRLHTRPQVWIAVLVNALSALVSVYASTYLDARSSAARYALVLLAVTSISWLVILASGTLISWIRILEENTVRRALAHVKNIGASLSNIDLPIAIETITFYITTPAQAASIAVFSAYVGYRSPVSLLLVVGTFLCCAAPLIKFARWRGSMIRTLRLYRNSLVDEFGVDGSAYDRSIHGYAHAHVTFFWRNMQAAYLLRVVVVSVLLAALWLNWNSDHAFSVMIAMMLLISEGNRLFTSVSNFQEDKVSLARVKKALRTASESTGRRSSRMGTTDD